MKARGYMSEFSPSHIHIKINGSHSPATWMGLITERVPKDLGHVFLRVLVNTVLEQRFKGMGVVSNPPILLSSPITETDFFVGQIVYRLVISPTAEALSKCVEDVRISRPSLLLVPEWQIDRAGVVARELGIAEYITVISIEGFVAMKINEFAMEQNKTCIAVFLELVERCNRRRLFGANSYHLELIPCEVSGQVEAASL